MVDITLLVRLMKRGEYYLRTPLYSNALYLIIGNGMSALLGFAFWAIGARFYTTENVGLMAAAIAAMGMVGSLSNLGLGIGLVRFLPATEKQGSSLLNFSLTLVSIVSVVIAVIFLLGLGLWSPGLLLFQRDAVIFIAFVIFSAATALVMLVDNAFVARRRAGFTMSRGLSMIILKLALVIGLAGLTQTYGIFLSWGIALCVSLFIGLFIFMPRLIQGYLPLPNFDWHGTSQFVKYSLVNNLVVLLSGLPGQILPIMLLGRLGAEVNAYFYIAWQITAALSMIPSSIATSLFAEGCHDEKGLIADAWRSLRLALTILLPVVIVVGVCAGILLRIFGSAYAENSTQLLQLLTLSLLPLAVNQVYFSLLRVQKRLKLLTTLNGIIALATLFAGYLLMPVMEVLGVGVAWVLGQTLVALWIAFGQGRGRLAVKECASLLSGRGGRDA